MIVNAGASQVIILGPDDHFRSPDVAGDVILARRSLFPDGEQLVTIPEAPDLSGKDVLIVHMTSGQQDREFMAFLQLLDIVRRRGDPRSVACFAPYLCYQRQDRAVRDGEPVTASVVVRAMSALGADIILTADRHGRSPEGRYMPRIVDVTCAGEYIRGLAGTPWQPELLIAPDRGAARRLEEIAAVTLPVVALDKWRDADGTHYRPLRHRLRGRRCLAVDDLCSSGSTLVPLHDVLVACGAEFAFFVTHMLACPKDIEAKVPQALFLAYSDSCGHEDAAVRALPQAIAAWRDTITQQREEAAGAGTR